MGVAEIDYENNIMYIRSHIITYGNAADELLTERIRSEIETLWNEPKGSVLYKNKLYAIQFSITSTLWKDISELEVLQNTDPRNNYFRIENFVHGNISFVDGIGCNSGYFLTENLYEGSTTAAHEYGHTLGLDHPQFLDIRGEGRPGIMYPRGTLVDAGFQYDQLKPAGVTGGTLHPKFRKVHAEDINLLKLHKLLFRNGHAVVGSFTNIYHFEHPKSLLL